MALSPEHKTKPGSRYLLLTVPIGLSLAVLGGSILVGSLNLRRNSRAQITGQHAQVIYHLWLGQKLDELGEEDPATLGFREHTADQLPTVLETARLPQLAMANLLGTRLFNPSGEFAYADPHVSESSLSEADLAELHKLKPIARLREDADLSEVSIVIPAGSPSKGPLLEVCVPLHLPRRTRLVAVAQFILEGAQVLDEFRTLDRNLASQAMLTFIAGGGLLTIVLGLSFRKLERVNQLLRERSQSLLRANQELALAAKTSAVGAVTAHLIHGLKNPLSGLQTFVASRGVAPGPEEDADWEMAISSTRRMQTMINEIVRVLRDEDTGSQYELSLPELAAMLETKVRPLARDAGVVFTTDLQAEGVLRNREANLLSLVLYNLVQNAIQATPAGKTVSVSFRPVDGNIVSHVRDEGPGIPESLRAELFKPCRSSKEGGTGIGLAISKQLANSIGAELELQDSTAAGSVFTLTFQAAQPAIAETATIDRGGAK